MPILKSCCGLGLDRGVIVIGVLFLLFSAIFAFGYVGIYKDDPHHHYWIPQCNGEVDTHTSECVIMPSYAHFLAQFANDHRLVFTFKDRDLWNQGVRLYLMKTISLCLFCMVFSVILLTAVLLHSSLLVMNELLRYVSLNFYVSDDYN